MLTSPLFLTILAASTTILGGIFSVFFNKQNLRGLGLSLSFSAGVMIYLSFMELLPQGLTHLQKSGSSSFWGLIAFAAGLLTIVLIDRLTPGMGHREVPEKNLTKIGLTSLILISVHNFPEGMAVYSVASEGSSFSWSLVLAIGIHNFPEGVVIAAPIYFATGNRGQAIGLASLSAIIEPLGGVVGYHFAHAAFQDLTLGLVFAFVAGIMIFLSLDQILPEARKSGDHHLVGYGTIAGMLFMATSLFLLN